MMHHEGQEGHEEEKSFDYEAVKIGKVGKKYHNRVRRQIGDHKCAARWARATAVAGKRRDHGWRVDASVGRYEWAGHKCAGADSNRGYRISRIKTKYFNAKDAIAEKDREFFCHL